MVNHYEAPKKADRYELDTHPDYQYRRWHFIYVVATVLGGSLFLTWQIAPKFAMSPDASILFFLSVASGPFSAAHHAPWIFSSPEFVVCCVVFVMTFLYLAFPHKATFIVSILGAIAWVLLGAFWILSLA